MRQQNCLSVSLQMERIYRYRGLLLCCMIDMTEPVWWLYVIDAEGQYTAEANGALVGFRQRGDGYWDQIHYVSSVHELWPGYERRVWGVAYIAVEELELVADRREDMARLVIEDDETFLEIMAPVAWEWV